MPTALLVAAPERMAGNAAAIAAAGARLLGQVTPEAADARIAQQIALDMILFDATGLQLDTATDTAVALARWAGERDCRVVAIVTPDAIDAVASPLLASAATVLCGELSLLAAQTNPGELMAAHVALERRAQGGAA